MMTREEIEANGDQILEQLKQYLDLSEERGLFLNNADWLLPLSYVEFLRDIGRHFRVNEMIRMEAYRQRLEREEGLSFIEFNYQLLQAYDFLLLFQRYGCVLQVGGDDQWGNILAGTDLIWRIEGKVVYGLTFPLLTTARGEKMGKTATGTIWLSARRTSAYEFYQYWINTDDRDVGRFLAYFTFLPIDEVRRLGEQKGAELREAKETLAYEVTALAHGTAEAEKARRTSRALFGGEEVNISSIPTTTIKSSRLREGIVVTSLFCEVGLTNSKGAARRLIEQGGAYINGQRIENYEIKIDQSFLRGESILIRAGKKRYHRVISR